jgi:tetratricopeptide (TPR) repeat protein
MSRSYFQSEEFKDLLKAYEEQRKKGRNTYFDADDFADIADFYLTVDKPALALDAISEGLSMHPDEEMLLSMQSSAYIYQHSYEKAMEVLQRLDVANPDVLYQRAQMEYANNGDTEKAEQMWRAWLDMEENRLAPEEAKRENYIHIISSLAELGGHSAKNEKSDMAAVRRWIREYIDLFQPLGKYEEDEQIVEICRENELPDLMSESLAQVLEERPYMPNGWSSLALAQYLAEQYEQALESCDFALAVNPDDLDALLTKAHTLQTMGQTDTAKALFKEYLDKGGDQSQAIPYAETLFRTGENKEAFACLEMLAHDIEVQMSEAERYYEEARSNIFCESKDVHQALQARDEACNQFKRTLTEIGDIYHHAGYYEKSAEMYKRITNQCEEYAEGYFMQGVNHLALEQYQEATSTFSLALQWADDRVMMGVDIALTFLINNYDQFALDVLDALGNFPENHKSPFFKNISAAKSVTYLKLGQPDQFLKLFKTACNETPDLVKKVYEGYFPYSLPFEQWYDYAEANTDDLMKRFQENDLYIKDFS